MPASTSSGTKSPRRLLRGLATRVAARREPSRPPAPFIVGVTRSGTTLLRLMLDAHPQMAIPPETYFVPDLIDAARRPDASAETLFSAVTENRNWGDLGLAESELRRRFEALEPDRPGDAVRAVFDAYAEAHGKPRWGDKTPVYLKRMRRIHGALPEARFVHMIRDGRDAALSRHARRLREPPPMQVVAERWRAKILSARETAERLPHYLEVRYEDLITDTDAVLRKVAEFSELEWDPVMLRYHENAAERLGEMARDLPAEEGRPRRPAEHRMAAHTLTAAPPDPSRLARWRTEMSAEDQRAFEAGAAGLLTELGYELRDPNDG